ncbi:hypothetical protein J2Z49_000818 [Desulfofundulus luciae]|uniref:Uncharacterized protein n=1 Tax=Desulfofundulus luciae TaxID=74702 RepID=A0ABU0B0A3_9FIRM|nr:hypothetical protein [Desulfofundulus luciae]
MEDPGSAEAGGKGCPPKFSRCPERLGWAVIEQVPDCHPVVALLPGGALSHQGGEGGFSLVHKTAPHPGSRLILCRRHQ